MAVCALQMWAYLATYQMPNDDPEALEARVRVDYPVRIDRAIGLGTLPTLRLQRALAPPAASRARRRRSSGRTGCGSSFPHGTVVYLLLRHREQLPARGALIYATFDIGVIGYWAIPTAPPWYAAQAGPDGRRPRRPSCAG